MNRAGPTEAPAGGERAAAPLTARERELLRLLPRGRGSRRIGEGLFLSCRTASVRVSGIPARPGARSRTETVTAAHRKGLPAPESAVSG
ncbi:response regulator transcription factor [Streptomyces sp. QTS137]